MRASSDQDPRTEADSADSAEDGPSPHSPASQSQPLPDFQGLLRELKCLRRQEEQVSARVRRSQRELALTKRRHKEARRQLAERGAEVQELSRSLGCAEGPEVDEWRELAREHVAKEQILRRQIEEEKVLHHQNLEDLQQQIALGGQPVSDKATEVEENRRRRKAADERCGRLQAVRDYLEGRLGELSLEELRELLTPSDSAGISELATSCEAQALQELDSYYERAEVILEEQEIHHQRGFKDLMQMSNSVLGHKDFCLRLVQQGSVAAALEDPDSCAPTERAAVREILEDVEAICNLRLALTARRKADTDG